MKPIVKRVLAHTCIYFTLTSLLLLFIYWVVSKDTSHGIQPLAFLLMLPFSFFFFWQMPNFRWRRCRKPCVWQFIMC